MNSLLRWVFDVLLYPFSALHPLVGLTLVSLVAAIGLLWVFKVTSNQDELAAVKRRIHGCFFEIRLFNDDLRAILRAQGEILRHNLIYLKLSIVPLLWMIVPMVLVIAQLQFHYGYQGLEPGETALVKVTLAGEAETVKPETRPEAALEVPDGLRVETPAVWIPSQRELAWRIAAEQPGDYEVRVRVGGRVETKSVIVSDRVVRRSPLRVGSSFLDQLIYPAEKPLPEESSIASIVLTYPGRDVGIGRLATHWMVGFFVLSMAFAFALRSRLGVTF